MKLTRKHFQISNDNIEFIKRSVERRTKEKGTSSESEVVRDALYTLQKIEESHSKERTDK